MDNLETTLGKANDTLAAGARERIIEVEQDRVIGGDPMENIPGRTVRQMVTNHAITMEDRLAMYKTPGWHGLGEVIAEELTGRQAIDRYLGWSVDQAQVFTEIDGAKRVLPLKANVRSDTKELLGVVSSDYVLVQNRDLGDFADALLQEAKDSGVKVQMETTGSLLGGRKIFLTMRPDREIRVGKTGQDVTTPYLTILNSFDGTLAMSACFTNVRVCCNNTYTMALNNITGEIGAGRGFKIRHKGKVSDYLQQAKLCLGLAVKGLEKYQEAATALAEKKLSKDDLRAYFMEVYESMYGPVPTEAATEADEIKKMRANKIIGEWTAFMGDDMNLFDGIGGSLWSAVNCVSQWMDHVRANKRIKQEDRRQHLRLLGAGAVDKRKAMKIAMATVG